jgi:hypothetical protein
MKVLAETVTSQSLKLELVADAGSIVELKLRRNTPRLKVRLEGASVASERTAPNLDSLIVEFPSGIGYQQRTVIVAW